MDLEFKLYVRAFPELSRFFVGPAECGTDAALKDGMEATPNMNPPDTDLSPLDPGRKCVRVTGTNSRGFVEFELSIGGAPELCVELTLPPAAFDAFCREQQVTRLDVEANP
ncbi:phenol hydroxylase subunit [Burkholderia cepacia]|uniref:phenol hydroxylase subunit n=1 Tax=Burkholderia cepacia TaxID=292 RepID=UPI001CF43D30|nr:phenol hydroxylase subunit [Burkholderia cepacia]MCA7928001.1 phenol hydroxylase subunit [Burkholderia cepacia]